MYRFWGSKAVEPRGEMVRGERQLGWAALVLAVAGWVSSGNAVAQARTGATPGAPATQAAMLDREIRMLEFIGGGTPLTPAERQTAVQCVQSGSRENPAIWAKNDATSAVLLARLAQHDPVYNATIRENARYAYAFADPQASGVAAAFLLEKAVVEAHDPTLVEDRATKRLITAHTLVVLQQASAWAAQQFGYAPPRADFANVVIPFMRQHLASEAENVGDGVAHVERNWPVTARYYASLTPAQHNLLFVKDKDATFHNMGDPVNAQPQLAEAAGMMSRFAARSSAQNGAVQSTTGSMLRSQQRTLNALHNAAVSGSPGCDVTKGSYADRYANGCYK